MVDVLAHSQKKLYLNSLVNGASTITLFIAAVAGSFWGLEGVAIGIQFGLLVTLIFSYRLMHHITGLRIRDFSEIFRPILIFAITFISLSLCGKLMFSHTDDWLLQAFEVATVTVASIVITLFACRAMLEVYIDLYGYTFRRKS
jgi:hypothetical protein